VPATMEVRFINHTEVQMKALSLKGVLSAALGIVIFGLGTLEGRAEPLLNQTSPGLKRPGTTNAVTAVPQSPSGYKPSGSEKSIIIVSGKGAKPESIGSPGSKAMLNPQPLPPKTGTNSIR
jgi:hypothetical protein